MQVDMSDSERQTDTPYVAFTNELRECFWGNWPLYYRNEK